MNIKLNKNKWWLRLHRYTYSYREDKLSGDGCKLGWELIFMPIVLIIGWPFMIFRTTLNYKTLEVMFFGFVAQIIFIVTGGFILENRIADTSYKVPLYYITGMLVIIVSCLVLFGFIFTIVYIKDNSEKFTLKKRRDKKKQEVKRESFIKTWYKAKKEKSCPRIIWEDE